MLELNPWKQMPPSPDLIFADTCHTPHCGLCPLSVPLLTRAFLLPGRALPPFPPCKLLRIFQDKINSTSSGSLPWFPPGEICPQHGVRPQWQHLSPCPVLSSLTPPGNPTCTPHHQTPGRAGRVSYLSLKPQQPKLFLVTSHRKYLCNLKWSLGH